MNESIRVLEEKIAYLERHVAEQDKAMFELGEDIAALRREMLLLRTRLEGGARGADAGAAPDDEKPPHY